MRQTSAISFFLLLSVILFLFPAVKPAAGGQDPTSTAVYSRLTPPLDETKLQPIKGQIHPLARAEFDQGVVDDAMPVEHLIVLLKRTPQQEQAAALLIDQLHNRLAPIYHQWLTAEEYGKRFGPTDDDLGQLTAWLQSKGFAIDGVPPGRTHITISGNAGMIREAFHSEIHNLLVSGEKQKAILSDPQVPAALAPLIAGFLHLHSWHSKPLHHDAGVVRRHKDSGGWEEVEDPSATPEITFTSTAGPLHAVTPQDWNTIYNANPLLQAGITGAGETIAVLEETEVANKADITSFRAQFGLPAYPATPNSTAGGINWMYGPGNGCTAPAVLASTGDESEALIDAEWAGAVAPKAIIDFVACKSTSSAIGSYGTDLAASYVANYLYQAVVAASLSYGECELSAGPSGTAYYSTLFQQMAAAGITTVVSSGDEGSTGCDVPAAPSAAPMLYATHNLSSNAFSSSVYNLAVGGTDFSDTYQGTTSLYWNNTDAAPYGSAVSYIPEMPWGGLCSSPLTASYFQNTGNTNYGATYTAEAICNNPNAKTAGLVEAVGGAGGVSSYNPLPTWQSVYGIGLSGSNTSTSYRNEPDISLFASNHASLWGHVLLYCQSDTGFACTYSNAGDAYALAAGGTSFVAPQIAGLMALINQSTQSRQGVANYNFYALAAYQYGVPGSPNTGNLANCSGSMLGGMIANDCTFLDISTTPNPSGGTVTGDIVQPCLYSSVTNCWRAVSTDATGLSSVGSHPSKENPAYQAGVGYDLATGLGSVNVYNLVANWNLDASFASSTTLAPNPASIISSQSTVLTATVIATGRGRISPAAGTVSFYTASGGITGLLLGTAALSPLCTGTAPKVSCAAATATLSVPGARLNPGANSIVAQFSGDGASDAPSLSSPATVTVSASSQEVITLNPTAVTGDAGTLNGAVNPQGAPGSAFFEWGTISSLSSYNSTGPHAVVANSTAQPFSASLVGLTSGTTYYGRIVFNNSKTGALAYGAILSFQTLQPVAITTLATEITSSGAMLQGTVNPGGSAGNVQFQWGTGSTLAANSSSNLLGLPPSRFAQSTSWSIGPLLSGTTYYFRLVFIDNATGNSTYSTIRSFTTLKPVVTTRAATFLTSSGATLNGTVNPNGTLNPENSPSYAYFEWGTSSNLASSSSSGRLYVNLGMTAQPFAAVVGSLASGATYYFRMVFYDIDNGATSYGPIASFKTLPPVVTTLAASSLTSSGAILNGIINPQGSTGSFLFQYGTSSSLASSSSCGPSGDTPNMLAQPYYCIIGGLASGATYYFRVAFYNSANSSNSYGPILSFKTLQPVVTTQAATSIASNSAVVKGTINPQGSPGNVEFLYGTSSTLATSGSCGSGPVSNNMLAQSYYCLIGGLASSNTYYFRIVFYDNNNASYTYGPILSFQTTSPQFAPGSAGHVPSGPENRALTPLRNAAKASVNLLIFQPWAEEEVAVSGMPVEWGSSRGQSDALPGEKRVVSVQF